MSNDGRAKETNVLHLINSSPGVPGNIINNKVKYW